MMMNKGKEKIDERREVQEEKEEEYLGERKSGIGENSLQVNGSPSGALIARGISEAVHNIAVGAVREPCRTVIVHCFAIQLGLSVMRQLSSSSCPHLFIFFLFPSMHYSSLSFFSFFFLLFLHAYLAIGDEGGTNVVYICADAAAGQHFRDGSIRVGGA